MTIVKNQPWYREPWPWFLILLPMSAVVASMITIWLAVKSADGLVEDDYYKQGIGINKILDRDQAAENLHLGANLAIDGTGKILTVKFTGNLKTMPETLLLSLLHPTQAGHDQRITLQKRSAGVYIAASPSLSNVRWRVILEAPQGGWRLAGQWFAGKQIISLGEAEKSE
jgi:uncharacterized protein